jgi:hypothetical protein
VEMNDLELTEEQIEEIISELHEAMQFYDAQGNLANNKVLAQIKETLMVRYVND